MRTYRHKNPNYRKVIKLLFNKKYPERGVKIEYNSTVTAINVDDDGLIHSVQVNGDKKFRLYLQSCWGIDK